MLTAPAASIPPRPSTPAPTSVWATRLTAASCRRKRRGPSDHARLDHHRAQARELVVDELLELRPRHHGRRPAVLLERLRPGLALRRLEDHLGQVLALLRGDARRAVHARSEERRV